MRRWNGWGEDTVQMDLAPNALVMLREQIGKGRAQPDYPLEQFLKRVPQSRLPRHPLISVDPKMRLDHAHGQSLPDWIGLRGGTLSRFPDGVALPATAEDVRALMQFAAEQNIVVIPYGGGTSVVGHLEIPQTDRPVISVSLERLNRLIDIEPDNMLATFEAGIRGPELEHRLGAEGFTLGHYPQSFEFSTLGGWVATRSSGQHSRHYGRMEQLFAGGEVQTPLGLVQMPPFPASAAGPDVRQLWLGSEGRLGILTKVIVRISHLPDQDEIDAIFFPSWDNAHKAVQRLSGSDLPFSMIRLSNPVETATNLTIAGQQHRVALLLRYLQIRGIRQTNACMCLIGFTGSRRLMRTARSQIRSIVRRHKGVSVGRAIGRAWQKNRFRSAYLRNTLWDLGYAVDTLETALIWDKVTPTLTAIENSLATGLTAWNERVHVFSHLSHVYATGSSIYTTFVFRLADTPEETLQRWKVLKQQASQVVIEAGGTISHQHGVGLDHKQYLTAEKGPIAISTLQRICTHLDPDRRMNPSKLLPDL